MAKNEKLNEEAGSALYIQPTINTDEMVLLNKLTDRKKQLPKKNNAKNNRKYEDE